MRLHNRQIKATFWNDTDLLQWPRDKRWFYEGLIQLADDSGCLEDSPFAFKLILFPSPLDIDITVEILGSWRDELIESGKLIRYSIGKKEYLYLTNFHKHQSIKNPEKPDVPLPPWIKWEPYESNSRSGKYVVSDDILNRFLHSSCDVLPIEEKLKEEKLIEENHKTHVRDLSEAEIVSASEADVGIVDMLSVGIEANDECEMQNSIVENDEDHSWNGNEINRQPIPLLEADQKNDEYSADFLTFWGLYPRKLGKREAWRKWQARIREKVHPEDMINAARHYAEYCRARGTEPQYIKHAATFLGPAKPYEEFVHGPPESLHKKQLHPSMQAIKNVAEEWGVSLGGIFDDDT